VFCLRLWNRNTKYLQCYKILASFHQHALGGIACRNCPGWCSCWFVVTVENVIFILNAEPFEIFIIKKEMNCTCVLCRELLQAGSSPPEGTGDELCYTWHSTKQCLRTESQVLCASSTLTATFYLSRKMCSFDKATITWVTNICHACSLFHVVDH